MAQFDVYLNPNPDTRKRIPYLLDVQSDMLDTLATRVSSPRSFWQQKWGQPPNN